MNTNDPLLLAVGISEIPPGQSEDSLTKKLLGDNYFFNRCLNRLVSEAALGVAQSIPKLEREALCNRLVPRVALPTVEWAVIMPDQNVRGAMTIMAKCGAETVHWNGDVKKIRQFRFHGESIPSEIVHLYEIHHGAPIDIDAGQQRRQKIAELQYQQDQRNKIMSPEEILVLEQYGKHPR